MNIDTGEVTFMEPEPGVNGVMINGEFVFDDDIVPASEGGEIK